MTVTWPQGEPAALAGSKQAVIQKTANGHAKRTRILVDLVLALDPAWIQ